MAHRLDQFTPLNLSDQSEHCDDVAHREVRRHLCRLSFIDHLKNIQAVLLRPANYGRNRFTPLSRHALPQLGKIDALEATVLQQCVNIIKFLRAKAIRCIPYGVGDLARDHIPRNMVRHTAQIFQQHNTQGGWQSPKLTQTELSDFLISMQECGKKYRIEHTVRMRNVGPGNAIHARQPLKWFVDELG